MRKKLSLLLAALAVAIIPGRATCATNPSFDQFGKLESDIAFVMPTHSVVGENLAFVMPTHSVVAESLAFVMPTHSVDESLAFVMPTHSVLGENFVMPSRSLVGENLTSVMPTLKLAMLPLGAETGRHIRNDDESQSKVEAVKHQVPNPVAEVVEHRNPTYAMLPLGRETGMHIRDLNEGNKEPAKSVAASGSKTTA